MSNSMKSWLASPVFPSPELADEHGLLCYGGDLSEAMLLEAYRIGVFPFYSAEDPLLWWSPDPRMVLFADAFHCSRRLRRRLRQARYRLTIDQAFDQVIHSCADLRKQQKGAWLLPEMIRAYTHLHRRGHAHSFEVWQGDALIGGLYGVFQHGVFFAESMFSRQRDGSKMAMAHMVEKARADRWKLIDCQFYTDHLASMGCREIPRRHFLQLLAAPWPAS